MTGSHDLFSGHPPKRRSQGRCVQHRLQPSKGHQQLGFFFLGEVANSTPILGNCWEMTSLSGTLGTLESREGVHKGLVVSVDSERNAF